MFIITRKAPFERCYGRNKSLFQKSGEMADALFGGASPKEDDPIEAVADRSSRRTTLGCFA